MERKSSTPGRRLSYRTSKSENIKRWQFQTQRTKYNIPSFKSRRTSVQKLFVKQFGDLNRQDCVGLKRLDKTLTILLDGCHKKGSRTDQTGTSTGLAVECTIFFIKTGVKGFPEKKLTEVTFLRLKWPIRCLKIKCTLSCARYSIKSKHF